VGKIASEYMVHIPTWNALMKGVPLEVRAAFLELQVYFEELGLCSHRTTTDEWAGILGTDTETVKRVFQDLQNREIFNDILKIYTPENPNSPAKVIDINRQKIHDKRAAERERKRKARENKGKVDGNEP